MIKTAEVFTTDKIIWFKHKKELMMKSFSTVLSIFYFDNQVQRNTKVILVLKSVISPSLGHDPPVYILRNSHNLIRLVRKTRLCYIITGSK